MCRSEFKASILELQRLIAFKRVQAREYIAIETSNPLEARANLGIAEKLHGEIIDLEKAVLEHQNGQTEWNSEK